MNSNGNAVRRPASLRAFTKVQGERGAALIGLSMAMLMPMAAHAQEVEEETLATVKVEDTAIDPNPNAQLGVPYKARTSGDERRTRPLAETPQTITVLTRQQIEDSGYTDLVRILDAQPGITVGTGENGNAFGDRYIIRGQEARSDVFVDGLRDPGMTTRESFAVEQIEISKGPSSSFAGRGTAGGAINAITKQATTDYNFGKADLGVGTDGYIRATGDVNISTGNDFAIRANALYAYTEVPDRKPADRKRKGLAVSALVSPTDDFSITVDYYGLRAHDNPDLGGYLNANRDPVLPPVYTQAQDFQDSDVDTGTSRIKYQFGENAKITNLTRWGWSNNGYVVTGARGATTHASSVGGAYPTITFSDHQGWQEVEYFANQTNLSLKLGGHEIIVGGEYTNHKVLNGVYALGRTGTTNCNVLANVQGVPTVTPSYCGLGPDGKAVANLNTLLGRTIRRGNWDQDWRMETVSGYLMDTFDLSPALTVFGGLRVDHFKFHLDVQNANTGALTFSDGYSDTFLNGHLGLTYKVGGGGVFYASASTSSDVNCGESDVGTNAGYGGCIQFTPPGSPVGTPPTIAGAKPERSLNFELGTKWNVLNEKLLLTAALFQTNKSDVMEGIGYTAVGTFNSGKNRVRGIELGIAGNITDAWSIQGGLTVMDAKITRSATPLHVGKTLSNFAKVQGQLQTRYQITDAIAVGGAVKYKSRRYGGQPDTAPAYTTNPDGSFFYGRPVPAYTVGDLFAEVKLTDNIELRLNVNNVTDKNYYLAVYQGGFFMYKGDGRQVVGTIAASF